MLKLFGHPPGVRPVKEMGLVVVVADKARLDYDPVEYAKGRFYEEIAKKGRRCVSRLQVERERMYDIRATQIRVGADTIFVGKRKAVSGARM